LLGVKFYRENECLEALCADVAAEHGFEERDEVIDICVSLAGLLQIKPIERSAGFDSDLPHDLLASFTKYLHVVSMKM